MLTKVNDKFTVSPIHLYFIVYVSIVDVGIMSFQREVVEFAGYDSWISVLLVGICANLFIWMMFKILNSQSLEHAQFVSIHIAYFGKWIGTLLNVTMIVYFIVGAFNTYRVYLEVVEVWIFPMMNMWPISVLLLILLYYAVSGGFQTVTGICVWGVFSVFIFVVPLPLLIIPYLHVQNLLPVFNHTAVELLQSSHRMAFQYAGFEILLVIYPFIQEHKKSEKWAHLAVISSTSLYLLLMLIAIMYFSHGQIMHTIWPSLSLISILEIPLMQRLEYLVLSIWLIKMVANISISLWAACRSLKLAFRIKPKYSLITILGMFVIAEFLVKDLEHIRLLTSMYANLGLGFIILLIPCLFVMTLIRIRNARKLQ